MAKSWIIPAFKLRMVPLVIPGLQGFTKFIVPEFVKTYNIFGIHGSMLVTTSDKVKESKVLSTFKSKVLSTFKSKVLSTIKISAKYISLNFSQ